jgi:hypothetical protein
MQPEEIDRRILDAGFWILDFEICDLEFGHPKH